MTHIWSPTLFHGGIIILQGVLIKFNVFLQNFHICKKNCRFNERPKI